MTKTTYSHLPSELQDAFPKLVTETNQIGEAVYLWVVDEKAQTALRNTALRDRWYCGGYGNNEGRFYVRFVQVKVGQKR